MKIAIKVITLMVVGVGVGWISGLLELNNVDQASSTVMLSMGTMGIGYLLGMWD